MARGGDEPDAGFGQVGSGRLLCSGWCSKPRGVEWDAFGAAAGPAATAGRAVAGVGASVMPGRDCSCRTGRPCVVVGGVDTVPLQAKNSPQRAPSMNAATPPPPGIERIAVAAGVLEEGLCLRGSEVAAGAAQV